MFLSKKKLLLLVTLILSTLVSTELKAESNEINEVLEVIQKDLRTLEKAVYSSDSFSNTISVSNNNDSNTNLDLDQNTEEVIVVDYKSQANNIPVQAEAYLGAWHHQGYKTQLDFYAYLLHNMGYQVAPYGYFYVCNADKSATGFHGKLLFEEVLVPYKWNIDWISSHIDLLLDVLKADVLPESNPSCENCAYAYQRNRLEIK